MRVLALAACVLLGCGYPSFEFSGHGDAGLPVDDGTSVDVASEAAAAMDAADADVSAETDAGCPLPTGAVRRLCTSIERARTGAVIDGAPSEMCGVLATPLDATNAATMVPASPPVAPPERALIRVVWSEVGLHVHVHVDDDVISVAPTSAGDDIWRGDSVELFIAGTAAASGDYVSDHALQFDVAPPSGTTPARARIFGHSGSVEIPAASTWSARLVTGGYEIEALLSWSLLGVSSPAAGATIGLDVAIYADDRPTAAVDDVWMVVANEPVTGVSPCGGPTRPSCDTRAFCTPTLLP